MKSHCWIWVTSQGRMYLWLIYLYSGCNGQYRSCPVYLGCSRSWNNCVTPAKSGIAALKQTAVCSVGRRSNWTWTHGQLPPGTLAAMSLPSVVLYHMERYATGLYGPLASGTCSAGIRENHEPGKIVPTMDCQTWSDALNPHISGISIDVLLFSECGHPLVHRYCVFTKGILHVSLRGSYLDNLQTFITQSEAVGRWGQDKDMAQLSPVHRGSAYSMSIRQRDLDEESPAVWLAGRALLARWMSRLCRCLQNVCFISGSAFDHLRWPAGYTASIDLYGRSGGG